VPRTSGEFCEGVRYLFRSKDIRETTCGLSWQAIKEGRYCERGAREVERGTDFTQDRGKGLVKKAPPVGLGFDSGNFQEKRGDSLDKTSRERKETQREPRAEGRGKGEGEEKFYPNALSGTRPWGITKRILGGRREQQRGPMCGRGEEGTLAKRLPGERAHHDRHC